MDPASLWGSVVFLGWKRWRSLHCIESWRVNGSEKTRNEAWEFDTNNQITTNGIVGNWVLHSFLDNRGGNTCFCITWGRFHRSTVFHRPKWNVDAPDHILHSSPFRYLCTIFNQRSQTSRTGNTKSTWRAWKEGWRSHMRFDDSQ